ncbi:vWA domain-containing protein [Chitinophaga varians]|uniref:vWA domain-containing protein n=1 Tax=Chitinophaga varians TaxID=2202339 RepID=UPI00165F32FF|nr:VWA-like domain-containing protein [Chitinophaga varians]MBC9909104.1 hypothetical protein [Chitinophaga varians]
MEAIQKISKAKMDLIMNHPFFATVSLHLAYISDPSVTTACTDGKVIKYSPKFIDTLALQEVVGLLAHEILHITLLHHTRMGTRCKLKWNIAADYAINPILEESGFKIPKGALIDAKYVNKSAEEIYRLLPDNLPDKSFVSYGVVDNAPSNSNAQELEAEIKQVVVQAVQISAKQKKLSPMLQRLVAEVVHPRVPWGQHLSHFLAVVCRNDYTWSKPSYRYLHAGLYLPTLDKPEIGNLVLIIDTSGSISDEIISQFAAEIQEVSCFTKTELTVIYVDHEVRGSQTFLQDEEVLLKPVGGGGTDYRPGFEYIDHCQLFPSAVVYLTDGMCYLFPSEPEYPVLWAQFGSFEFYPPFGNVINIE